MLSLAMHNFSLILITFIITVDKTMQINTISTTLQESFMISPKVKHFIFKTSTSPLVQYAPGQFITIHFTHDGHQIKRSYSIANPPNEENRIEFAAGYYAGGPGTSLLFNLNPGDVINVSGPYGRLVLKQEDPKRYILIGTSTGVTPYRAMIKALSTRLEQQPNLNIVLLQGVQRREEILYAQEFMNLAQQFNNVTFRPCLSKMSPEEVEGHEFSGYVQHLLPELNLNPEQDVVYLCFIFNDGISCYHLYDPRFYPES